MARADAKAAAGRRAARGEAPVKLFLGGLTRSTTTKMLREHFAVYGRIMDCVAMAHVDGKPRGFGYVTMDSEAAVRVLSEIQVLDDRILDVKPAVPGGANQQSIGKGSRKASKATTDMAEAEPLARVLIPGPVGPAAAGVRRPPAAAAATAAAATSASAVAAAADSGPEALAQVAALLAFQARALAPPAPMGSPGGTAAEMQRLAALRQFSCAGSDMLSAGDASTRSGCSGASPAAALAATLSLSGLSPAACGSAAVTPSATGPPGDFTSWSAGSGGLAAARGFCLSPGPMHLVTPSPFGRGGGLHFNPQFFGAEEQEEAVTPHKVTYGASRPGGFGATVAGLPSPAKVTLVTPGSGTANLTASPPDPSAVRLSIFEDDVEEVAGVGRGSADDVVRMPVGREPLKENVAPRGALEKLPPGLSLPVNRSQTRRPLPPGPVDRGAAVSSGVPHSAAPRATLCSQRVLRL